MVPKVQEKGVYTSELRHWVTTDQARRFKGMSVDDFLGGEFLDPEGDDEVSQGLYGSTCQLTPGQNALSGLENEGESDSDEDDMSDHGSFASVDDLEDDADEGRNHLLELSKLAEKDPEFYKYLQENDRELLEFDPAEAGDEDEEMSDAENVDSSTAPILTKTQLQKWQQALLKVRVWRQAF